MNKTILLLIAYLASACTSRYQEGANQININPSSNNSLQNNTIKQDVSNPTITASSNFEQWKLQFIERAIAQGIKADTVHRLLDPAQEKKSVSSADKKQPEFVKTVWQYLDSAVSQSRISKGRDNIQNVRSVVGNSRVPAEITAAIWGLESGFGANTGNVALADALGTLASEGRRKKFAEEQLISLMRLLESGDLDWHSLTGSWAGGMGHTQFIPQTWENYGVDANKDGKRNPWQLQDALASTANYLSKSGWQANLDPIYELRVSPNFDFRNLIGQTKTFAQWQSLGADFIDKNPPAEVYAKLWLPAGINGPILLTTRNFEVIKVYNHSDNYALAVSLLAQGIAGSSANFTTPWPTQEQQLSRTEISQLQMRLIAAGFDTKGTDGVAGSNTKKAFSAWQKAQGDIPDGFISKRSAAKLLN